MKVFYQGITGSYSEQAIIQHFGTKAEPLGLSSFKDVFSNVHRTKNTYGVIPVENSIAGSIAENYDLLRTEEVVVIAEIYLPVKHVLIVNKGVLLKDIKRVCSHPQALAQCDLFLREHNLKSKAEYDTAGAVRLIKKKRTKYEAAIASERCAKILEMDVVAKKIMNNKNNTTRFLVFVKEDCLPNHLTKEKTSIVFKTKHLPGALIRSLENFLEINLTKIESRPNPESNWEYFFYVDLEGGIGDKKIDAALLNLKKTVESLKIIGSYPIGKQ